MKSNPSSQSIDYGQHEETEGGLVGLVGIVTLHVGWGLDVYQDGILKPA